MPWCGHCSDNHSAKRNIDGFTCCTICGRVLKDRTLESFDDSKFITKEERLVRDIAMGIGAIDKELIIREAHNSFLIAVETENFPSRRIRTRVAAVCLYVALRHNGEPYLLVDFADYLTVSVYVLGALFVVLSRILKLESHPSDPSLFIHRFSDRLLGRKDTEMSITALRIVASVKRDWMQKVKNPGRLFGAALYVSAIAHGYKRSKEEVMCVVNTELGCLTMEEFVSAATEVKGIPCSSQHLEVICEHKNSGETHFAHGLCRECYDTFVEFAGLKGFSEPRVFLVANRLNNEKDRRFRKGTEISETFSSIDDREIALCINNEQEKLCKTMIWDRMNKEYLEEQEAKKAAGHIAKPRKERKQRQGNGSRNSRTDEASKETKNSGSSRINYAALSALYDDGKDGKRQRTELDTVTDGNQQGREKESNMPFYTENVNTHNDAQTLEDDEPAEVAYDDYCGDGDEAYAEYEKGFGDGDEYMGEDYGF